MFFLKGVIFTSYQTTIMTPVNSNPDQQDRNSVSGYYEDYNEVQKDVLAIETRKTRNVIFTIAAVVLASDLMGLLVLNAFFPETILIILIIPAILVIFALLAMKEPLTAISLAAILIVSLWIYTIVVTKGQAAIMGWLIKAVIVYFIIAGFQHAREATRIKRELSG
jgi:hypothetical protein